jgi:hypothetical protein
MLRALLHPTSLWVRIGSLGCITKVKLWRAWKSSLDHSVQTVGVLPIMIIFLQPQFLLVGVCVFAEVYFHILFYKKLGCIQEASLGLLVIWYRSYFFVD